MSKRLTVGDIMALPSFSRCRVVAGMDSLDRPVDSVTVADILDIAHWLNTNDFVHCVGRVVAGLSSEEAELALLTWVKSLIDAGASCLAIKLGRYIDEIPPSVLALGNERHFPIITLPEDATQASVTGAIYGALVRLETEASTTDDAQTRQVSQLLESLYSASEVGEVRSLAAQLGLGSPSSIVVGFIMPRTVGAFQLSEADVHHVRSYIEEHADAGISTYVARVNAGIGLLCFLNDAGGGESSSPAAGGPERLQGAIAKYSYILSALDSEERPAIIAGIGTVANGIAGMIDSARRARETITTMRNVGLKGPVIAYNGLGKYALLALLLRDPEACADYVTMTIGPLLEKDRNSGTDWAETLRVMLEENMCFRAAAGRLLMHPHSVRYRMEKYLTSSP